MSLSSSQLQAVMDHLKKHMPIDCPVCGERDWSIGKELSALPRMDDPRSGKVTLARSLPVVSVHCQNCYFMFFMPAAKVGLVEAD